MDCFVDTTSFPEKILYTVRHKWGNNVFGTITGIYTIQKRTSNLPVKQKKHLRVISQEECKTNYFRSPNTRSLYL